MKTNNLVFKTSRTAKNGDFYIIEIKLNDECKNGYQDFSITGTTWCKNTPHTEGNICACGAMGDTISIEFPEYAIFNRLHLCDVYGSPMYAVENGYYHVKKMLSTEFCEYFRCTDVEYNNLQQSEDVEHFRYLLTISDIPKRWLNEANEAIKILEDLTGEEFLNDSTKTQFIPCINVAEYEQKIKSGYFSDANRAQRLKEKRTEATIKAIAKITADRDRAINKANTEFYAKLAVLNYGLSIDNFIFYNHTSKGVFNWKDYDDKITKEQFDCFVKNVQVEGVIFEIK
jgi:hypothetical protein